jgi:hypothetical protein|tara:strand:- start:292 stop:747 length:456 start_codon:yes stop_codon:yes gene_type:complete
MNIKEGSFRFEFCELLPLLEQKDKQLYQDLCEFLNDNARFTYECVGFGKAEEVFSNNFTISNTAVIWGNTEPKQKAEVTNKGFSSKTAWQHIQKEYARMQEEGLSARRLLHAINYNTQLDKKGLSFKDMPFPEWYENLQRGGTNQEQTIPA